MALQYILDPGLEFDDKEKILEGILQLKSEDNGKDGIFEIVEENDIEDKEKLDMLLGIKGKYITDVAFIKKNFLGGEKGLYDQIGEIIKSQYPNKTKEEIIPFSQQIFKERHGILSNKIWALYKLMDCASGSELLASDFGEEEITIYLSKIIHRDVNYKAFYFGNKNTPPIRGLLSFYNLGEQVEIRPGFIMAVYDRIEELKKKDMEEHRKHFLERINIGKEERELEKLRKKEQENK